MKFIQDSLCYKSDKNGKELGIVQYDSARS